jgi:thiol-disulfide isomerase/thioredoxin
LSSKRAQPARKAPPARKVPPRKKVAGTPPWVMPASVVAGVAVLIVAFLIYRWYITPPAPPAPSTDTTAQVVTIITTLPASELDAVGQGTADNLVKPVTGSTLNGPGGKPEVFYYGAEFCPYCAAERWPLIIALSRFGTFTGLQTTSSSSNDVYPNTMTFTFRSATYTSQYIEFRSVETSDRDQKPLQSPTPSEQQLVSKYDSDGSIPFVDFANKYAFNGATYKPDVISGTSWLAIADSLKSPDSPQAKAILGSANLITAAICKATADQPASVCSSATIQGIEKNLK